MQHDYTILETRRLMLQTLQWDLFPELATLLSNPKVHRYFPHPLNEIEAREFMKRVLERDERDGHSFWAVFKKEDSTFIGICGLLTQMVDGQEELEVGYRLDDAYWGQGFAPEAAAGCVKYAKEKLKAHSVISLIRPINRQSIRVAEKNGFICERETMFHHLPHLVYRKIL